MKRKEEHIIPAQAGSELLMFDDVAGTIADRFPIIAWLYCGDSDCVPITANDGLWDWGGGIPFACHTPPIYFVAGKPPVCSEADLIEQMRKMSA